MRMEDMKIKVTAETEGIDEATDEIHELSDALMEFPPNVMIKNCNYCTFNIYPSQTQFVESKAMDEPQTDFAWKGGCDEDNSR